MERFHTSQMSRAGALPSDVVNTTQFKKGLTSLPGIQWVYSKQRQYGDKFS